MAVQWDSVKVSSVDGEVNYNEWYHYFDAPKATVIGRGKNPCLVIMAGMQDAVGEEFIDSVTVDGSPATIAQYAGFNNMLLAYYLNPQLSYFTPLIRINYSGSAPKGCIGVSYLLSGVHQTTPLGNLSSVNGNNAAPNSGALTCGINSLALYFLGVFVGTGGISILTPTLEGHHPQLFAPNYPGDGSPPLGTYAQGYHAQACHGSGAARTASWTLNSVKPWTIHKCEINPAPMLHTSLP